MENPLLGQEPLPQFLKIRPEHVEPAVRELLLANRARVEELSTPGAPDLRKRRGADGGTAPSHHAHLVPGEPPERGAQLRGAARRLQRLPAAAVGLLHRPCAERAAVPGVPRAWRRSRARRSPRCSGSCSSTACATSAWQASACPPSARSVQDRDAGADAAAGEVRGERARCDQCLDAPRDRGCRARRAQRDAHRAGAHARPGTRGRRLGAHARPADLRRGGHRCAVTNHCGARSTRPGPRVPPTRARTPGAGTTRR